jgi:hypothetical protein
MSQQNVPEEPDDVEGHRFLTPEQAQQRAEEARRERAQRQDEAGSPTGNA